MWKIKTINGGLSLFAMFSKFLYSEHRLHINFVSLAQLQLNYMTKCSAFFSFKFDYLIVLLGAILVISPYEFSNLNCNKLHSCGIILLNEQK